MKKMTKDEMFAIFCATVLIFSALINPLLSLGIAIGSLCTLFIYKIKWIK